MLMRLLSRLFSYEEINGGNRCPTYLHRWTLFRAFGCGVYLHRFVADDWSLDLHDHPKRFVSIGLAGEYTEHTPKRTRIFRAPWLRTFPASHAHRITLRPGVECWTLVIVLRAARPWGFWHAGTWIHWREYVRGKFAHIADLRAVCAGIVGGDR